ncbi:MAG: FAD-binding protein [Coriobacteriales bacterium]|jgi:succinate dehydrogenase/fumarate reductase flavoprotein subunit|nr:FAD-binding protein [Coriobacteriales bacterium]
MDQELSRRGFLKGSVLAGAGAAAAAALAGPAGMLAGCSPRVAGSGGSGSGIGLLVSPGGIPYAVHEADVVVVGGGMAGLNAARVASDRGSSVVLVDKGPAGHSGNSGVLWGQTYVTAEKTSDDGVTGTQFLTIDCMGILDQEQARNVVRAQVEGQPRRAIELAGNMLQRGDDAKVVGIDDGGVTATHNALYKQTAQMLIKRGIPYYEHMMMLDILLDDAGAAAGVVAISLADGSAHVFRGKKTILCTGGYHWATGKTGGSPESTGEGHYALLKRGHAFKDMEFPQYDFCGIHPFGWRPDTQKDAIDIAVTLPVNGDIHRRMCNKDKQNYTAAFFADPSLQSIAAFQGALITTAKELFQGKGTPGDGTNNGILFDLRGINDEPSHQSYPSYKGLLKFSSANLGYEYPDYLECVANEYSSAGVPVQDPETCEHEIPGLYTVFVALSAMSSMWNWGQSYLAAKDASARAQSKEVVPAFSPDDVDVVLKRAYGLLEKDAAGTVRSTEVHRRIQRAFYRGQDFMKDETGMRAMLAELERIQSEDLPLMACVDKSRAFNRDWKMALEAEGMLYCSLATVHAALARKESRSPFFRKDYPKMDNANYLCCLWTSLGKDGRWKVEKRAIVDTVMPRSEIMKVLDDSNPKYDISVPNQYL